MIVHKQETPKIQYKILSKQETPIIQYKNLSEQEIPIIQFAYHSKYKKPSLHEYLSNQPGDRPSSEYRRFTINISVIFSIFRLKSMKTRFFFIRKCIVIRFHQFTCIYKNPDILVTFLLIFNLCFTNLIE